MLDKKFFESKNVGIGYEDIDAFAKESDGTFRFTVDPEKAIYVFPNGEMISGWSKEAERESAMRDSDHWNTIDGLVPNVSHYSDKDAYGKALFAKLNLVMLVPETKTAIYDKKQILTRAQEMVLHDLGYTVMKDEQLSYLDAPNRINEIYIIKVMCENNKYKQEIEDVLCNLGDIHEDVMCSSKYTDVHETTEIIDSIYMSKPLEAGRCEYTMSIRCESVLDLCDVINEIGLTCPEVNRIAAYCGHDTIIDTDKIQQKIKEEIEKKKLLEIEKQNNILQNSQKKAAKPPRTNNTYFVVQDVLTFVDSVKGVEPNLITKIYQGGNFVISKTIKSEGTAPLRKIMQEKVLPYVRHMNDEGVLKQYGQVIKELDAHEAFLKEKNKEGGKEHGV